MGYKYSYEFKRKCVELFRQGKWAPKPPEVADLYHFRAEIRKWARLEDKYGPDALKRKARNTYLTPDEKLRLVKQVEAGGSLREVAENVGISHGILYRWVQRYREEGYNGLVNKSHGRRPKDPAMKKMNINNPRKLEESEYEELVRLRAENEYMKAEVAVIKKEIALREQKEAARLKAKKQRSSGNSGRKDTT